MGNGQRLHREGSVTVVQSDTDPGDMGEPRELTIDGHTLLIVPSFELWGPIDVIRLAYAMAVVGPVDHDDSNAAWFAYAQDVASKFDRFTRDEPDMARFAERLGQIPVAS